MLVVDNRFSSSGRENTRCLTQFSRYVNGQPSLMLYTEKYEQWTIASVAIEGEELPAGYLFTKDYSENEGMVALLRFSGVIEGEPVKTVRTGFVAISAYRLTEEALQELNH